MSFFATSKNAAFAEKAFAEAGIDFKSAVAAGNVNVIKDAIAASAKSTDSRVEEADKAISELSAANSELTAKLAKADADAEAKVKAAKDEAEKSTAEAVKKAADEAALAASVKTAAACGHPVGVKENVPASGAKSEASNLTGLARVAASLRAERKG